MAIMNKFQDRRENCWDLLTVNKLKRVVCINAAASVFFPSLVMSPLGGICRIKMVNKTQCNPWWSIYAIKKVFLFSLVLLPKAENLLSTVTNGLSKNRCSMLECSRISVKFIHLFYPHIFHRSMESLLTFSKVLKKMFNSYRRYRI